MRQIMIAAAVMSALAISTLAQAQTAQPGAAPVKVQSGERVYAADGSMIGRVEYLDKAKDGALKGVAVVFDTRLVHIPADSLSVGEKGVQTSLKRADVAKLN